MTGFLDWRFCADGGLGLRWPKDRKPPPNEFLYSLPFLVSSDFLGFLNSRILPNADEPQPKGVHRRVDGMETRPR